MLLNSRQNAEGARKAGKGGGGKGWKHDVFMQVLWAMTSVHTMWNCTHARGWVQGKQTNTQKGGGRGHIRANGLYLTLKSSNCRKSR